MSLMSGSRIQAAIRITHIPTGIQVERVLHYGEKATMKDKRESALRELLARILACDTISEEVVREYDKELGIMLDNRTGIVRPFLAEGSFDDASSLKELNEAAVRKAYEDKNERD